MQFLVDVHLPISLSKFLSRQSDCKAIHVNQILARWHTSDKDICKYADENDLVVITKDSDFKNSYFVNRTPKKVVRILLGNVSNHELVKLFEYYLPHISQASSKERFYIEISREQLTIIY